MRFGVLIFALLVKPENGHGLYITKGEKNLQHQTLKQLIIASISPLQADDDDTITEVR